MKGTIRKRGNGSWEIRYDLPRHPDGRRNQKSVAFRGTKREAEQELCRQLHEVNTDRYVEPSRITLGEYLDDWLENGARPNVSGKTYERYCEHVRVHLKPALGKYRLIDLKPLIIQRYYSRALQSGRRDGKGGLSPQTVLHQHRVLRAALAQAVKWQLLGRNPADAVEPPRPERREITFLDEEQTAHLLTAARDSPLYPALLIAAITGLRRGEVCALTWEQVDLRTGTVSVHRSLEETREGLRIKPPKTKKGRRSVELPAFAVAELAAFKRRQEEALCQAGIGSRDQAFVIAQPDGTAFPPSRLTKAFTALVKKAGLPRVRLHDLRHGHASHLLRLGVPAKVVQERLGHGTISVTMDLYSHLSPGMGREAANRIDAAFRAVHQEGESNQDADR